MLFILTEDQGAQLGYVGTKGVETPHMDALARGGVYFSEAFVAYPVCSASKAAIYTGLHNHVNGLMGNTLNYFRPADKLTDAQKQHRLYQANRVRDRYPTLIEILRDAGYHLAVTSKLHVLPNHKFPFHEYRRIGRGAGGAGRAVKGVVERARQNGRPWFLMLNISWPHRPFRNSDKTAIGVDPQIADPPGFLPDTPVVRQDWAEYLDAVEQADRQVGEGLAALRASGEENRTIVVFMGDHGPGFHRGKMSLHDFGLRVPLAIKGPGIRKGVRSDALVSELDLMPTLLDLLGLDAPALQHGLSLRPILEGKPGAKGHDHIFAEIAHGSPITHDGMQERSVYDGRYHLIYREGRGPRTVNADLRDWAKWRNRSYAETVKHKARFPEAFRMLREIDPGRLGSTPPRLELYDLGADPGELRDLAGVPEHRQAQTRLLVALRRWAKETGDQAIHPQRFPIP
ncbi:MAG: sulfatase [Planctomycetota bacterium]